MKLAASALMQELDRKAIRLWHVPSLDLMDRAAEAVAQTALDLLPAEPRKCRVTVFCGTGNNGGDGISAARFLSLAGVHVRIFLVGNYARLSSDALEETRRLSDCGIELEPFDPESPDQSAWAHRCHVLVDAIFGIGLCREIEEGSVFAQAVDLINACSGKVVAVDIPSGVDAGTGCILGRAVQAQRTATFTLPKPGHFVGDGAVCSGEVRVHDIGIPQTLVREAVCPAQTVERAFVRAALPPRKRWGHKGDFGKALIIGGSVGYTGAPWLSAEAAVRSGCGLVSLGVPEAIWAVEAGRCGSAMPFPLAGDQGVLTEDALPAIREKLAECDALAIGPGLGRDERTGAVVRTVLAETEKPVVLDADGINALAGHIDILDSRRGRTTILTPHDGEFARLTGAPLSRTDRAGMVQTFAKDHGCVLVLKGWRTLTAGPGGNVLVNATGCSGLAKGGSGDVLTGLIVSLLVQGASPVQAAAAGVWLHGRAGEAAAADLSDYCMTPEDVVRYLPETFAEIVD